MNLLKMKCHVCGDVLTDGEMKTHMYKPAIARPICYQDTQKQIKAIKEKYQREQEEKKEEFAEKIREQHDRWGAPRGF